MSHSIRLSATDQEIQKWVVRKHGFLPHRDWIAHCKELCGLITATPEHGDSQQCPPNKQPAIKQAFRHFGLLKD